MLVSVESVLIFLRIRETKSELSTLDGVESGKRSFKITFFRFIIDDSSDEVDHFVYSFNHLCYFCSKLLAIHYVLNAIFVVSDV